MKKRKILYLFPLAALVLSGCTFEEGWNTTKTWLSDHIWTPILNLFGGKKSDSSDKKQDGGNTPAPSTDSDTEEIVATEVGSVDNPLSVTEFQTLCDANLEYDGLEEGKSATDFAHIAYVTAKVSSNTWNTEGTKIQYLNLVDKDNSSLQITGMFVIVDASVTGDYSAKDSLKGLEVVVKGYPALYNKKNSGKTYELVSKDKSDTENPRLMKVVEPEGTPGVNYGSLEAPLTVTEAKGVIDQENPTAIKMYVQGEVKSNEAWSSSYGNVMRITLTDGQNDIVVFKCATFPADVTKESITANSLVGLTALAYGLGELYQSTTYELTAPSIISFSGEVTPPTPVDNFGTLDNPLSIAEAKAVIDAQNPTTQEMYVTGTVKSNTAWSTQFNNVDIVLTDDQGNEFTVWRTATLPDSLQPTADQLVGKVVVAHGTGKLYNTTYELDQGCVVDSIEDAAPVVVENVVLSEEQIELEVGGHASLTASVLPAKASQEVEWSFEGQSISRTKVTSDVAEYDPETHVLTGLDTGDVTIVATSVADPTVSASCSIHVVSATKSLDHIEIDTSNAKTNYVDGEDYSSEGLAVTAVYDDNSTEDVTSLGVQWSFDPTTASFGDDQVAVTATYEGKEAQEVIAVTVAEAKGTAQNPYTVEEARAAVDAGEGITDVYASGIVTSIAYAYSSTNKNMSFFFSTTGAAGVELEAYKLSADEDPNIEVGDNVTVRGDLTKYNSTYEFNTGCTLVAHTKPTVSSVAISGTATQTTYSVGVAYNHNGLVATALLDNGAQKDVTSSATWAFDPETASLDDTEVSITATYGGVTSTAVVVPVTVTEDAPPAASQAIFALGDDGDAAHVDGSAATDYTETNSGKTLTISNGVKMFKGARDAKGNGCLKFGTSSLGGSFTIDLSAVSGINKVIIKAAQYKSRSDCTITIADGAAQTMTKKSDNGEYDEYELAITTQTSISVVLSGRAMINEIIFEY